MILKKVIPEEWTLELGGHVESMAKIPEGIQKDRGYILPSIQPSQPSIMTRGVQNINYIGY